MTPFLIYIYSFIGVMVVYSFNWSRIYPNLSWELIGFLVFTFIISYLLHIKLPNNRSKYKVTNYSSKIKYVIIFILGGFILDFIYAGNVPLIGESTGYLTFTGIPMIHVILYTFTIFISLYIFKMFIDNFDKKKLIFYFILTLVPGCLLVSRGMIMNIIIGCIFILIRKIGLNIKLYKKYSVICLVSILFIFYLFGIFGNIRNNTINKAENKYSSLYIMEVGGATDSFRNSIIPKPFFWGYTYIASPLANLQLNINKYDTNITLENAKKFVIKELLPDFISKRLYSDEYLKIEGERPLVTPTLTVATFYVGAYNYIGWIGMIIIFSVLMIGSYIYLKLISESNPFKVISIAMLCNMVVLCTFDNMISYSGMSFQLVYPIIWEVWDLIKSRFLNNKHKSRNEKISRRENSMKVLLVNRKDANERFGGDTVQMYNTQKELIRLGLECDVALGEQEEKVYKLYDIVHIFNIQTEKFTYKEAKKVKRVGTSLAVSPIWWSYQNLLNDVDEKYYTNKIKMIKKLFGKKIAIIVKEFNESIRNRKRKKILDFADIILPNSKMEIKDLNNTFQTNYEKKCNVIYNGVEEKFLNAEEITFNEDLLKMDFSKYGYATQVGRIELEKNTLLTIKACNELNIPLVIIGEASNIEYKKLCEDEAKFGKVYFMGRKNVDDIIKINKYAKVHILPSYRETPGLATLEAAALGCNIVSTSIGSTKEYFGEKVYYCDPNNYDSIKNAINLAWNKELNENLKKFISKKYNWKVAAEQTQNAYISIKENIK